MSLIMTRLSEAPLLPVYLTMSRSSEALWDTQVVPPACWTLLFGTYIPP